MNYTKNYHLPQWDENDRVMRTDFNQMCADMENGLLKTARDAAEAVTAAAADAAFLSFVMKKNCKTPSSRPPQWPRHLSAILACLWKSIWNMCAISKSRLLQMHTATLSPLMNVTAPSSATIRN